MQNKEQGLSKKLIDMQMNNWLVVNLLLFYEYNKSVHNLLCLQ